MNPFCEEAVAKVAAGLGKKIPAGYMRGIDDKFASTARYLASVDKDGFRAKDAKGRMEAVADAIEQDIRHKAIKDAQRAELNAIKQDTRKGELRAMLGEGQGGISSLQKMIGFIAEASSRKSTSIETAIKVEQNAYLRGIEELLNADNGAHFLGYLVDPQKSKVLIRELFGENTGDADARLLAETYRKSNKQQLDNYNKEGGDIAPLEGYIPLSLDPMKLWGSTFDWSNGLPRRMTQQERMKKWVDFEITLVDRNRMVDLNGKPMDDAGLRKFLEESWWTRVTDGRIKSRGESGLSSGIANRHKKHKQIFYKDADSFMAAMEKGGGGNIFENIISHTNKLAGEMAIMRQLGPNAYETYSQLRDMAIEADKASFKLDESKLNQTDRMFDLLMGLGGGIEGNPNVHRFFRNIKDISGAHLLGSIISSQLADNGTALATMRYLGVALDDWGILKGDFYTNPELKRWAKDNVVLFDAMTNNLARWGDMATSTTIPSKLLSSVYRISGANALTVNHRQSVAAAISNHIGGLTRDFTWDTLPEKHKKRLAEKGIDQSDFEIMAASRVDNGGKDYTLLSIDDIHNVPDSVVRKFIKEDIKKINELLANAKQEDIDAKIIEVIENKKRDVSGKLVAAMLEEAEMAVVQPTLSSTAKMSYQKGMLVPELGALVTQFKNFPMAVYNQHLIQRLGSLEGQEKIAYGLHLMMTTTLFGGMGLILSDLIMGKDPRRVFESGNPKVTMKFALEAMAKGGGLPFLADWMNMQWDGRDPVEKLTGPGLGMAVSAGKLAASATKFAISGGDPDTKLARNALDFGRKFVPFENMWWFRAPLNNYLTAELYEMASPGHKDRMRGLAALNNGSEYFWGMGNARLPNLGNITK